ncbi:hypothetical protein QJQ45_022652 [Haematococcus lacustris]|nr:hypothetical protein QJQ45_022652 [Haematococcus lacustris]
MQPMQGRPPSGPPGQAPTHPSPLTPFTLAASPGRGQGAGTPPGGPPRLGVPGRGGPGPGAGPEGGRAAALAFIRSLEVPAFTPRHPAAAGPPADAPKAPPLASSPPPAAAPREAAAAVGPPAGTGMQHSAVPAATSSKNEAGAASPNCHREGTASPCLSGAGAAAVASGKEGLAGGGAMNANGSPMSGALLSHAITLASSLSVMEGSVTSGTSPDSHRASGLNVQVAQQLANLSDKPKEVQEALASVGEVLANITSGSLTELANEDLLLLLNTKDGLLQHLPNKWLQAAVNKSLAEGGRTLPRQQPGI